MYDSNSIRNQTPRSRKWKKKLFNLLISKKRHFGTSLVTKSKNNPCISSKHFFGSPLVHFPNENYKLPNQMTLSTAWWPDAIRSITNPSLENKRRRTLGMIGGLQGFFPPVCTKVCFMTLENMNDELSGT